MIGQNSLWGDLLTAGPIGIGGIVATYVAGHIYRIFNLRRSVRLDERV
jgi:hypothetical protein